MKSVIPLIMVLAVVPAQMIMGQAEPRPANPWLSAADRLPPFLHKLDVELIIDGNKIETYEPVIARITLTNRDDKPLGLRVRQDGAPLSMASLVSRGDDEFERHDQWLRRSGPVSREINLAPGESTTGKVLVLFGGPPTGFPFAEAGPYMVKFACQPDGYFAPVYTNEVRIIVSHDDRGNAAFLDDLSGISYTFFGWDPESVVRNNGEDYIIGIRLLQRIINQRVPHRVDLDQNRPDRKEAELVESLTNLLGRHPNSSYSGYIARYLGLLHIHAIADKFSLGRHEVRENAEHSSLWDGTACRAHPSYKKALQYLTTADKSDLWPRATAIENLAALHTVAQEWDQANACLMKLRTKYAEGNGVQRADELEGQMAKYKAKLERRKAAAP